jgi:hypothetical protein
VATGVVTQIVLGTFLAQDEVCLACLVSGSVEVKNLQNSQITERPWTNRTECLPKSKGTPLFLGETEEVGPSLMEEA